MNERTYLKRISTLKKELERAQNAELPDSDAFNDLIDNMNSLNDLWYVSLGRKRWIVRVVWFLLCCLLLAWLIFTVT